MLEEPTHPGTDGAADTAADGVTHDPAGEVGVAGFVDPDGLDFLPDLLASLTADGLSDRELVTQISTLETLTSAAAAAKAVLTADLHRQRCATDAATGLTTNRRGRGVGAEVALARRESPWTGRQRVRLAQMLTEEMPHALAALRRGDLNEDQAMILVRESADLCTEDHGTLDDRLIDRYASLSTKELTIAVRREANRLDPANTEERARRAREQRKVTFRGIGDGMCRITGQVPAEDALTTMASLRDHADMRRTMGDERTRDQLVADTFTDRLNTSPHPAAQAGPGQDAAAPKKGVEIQLVMNADMLLGNDTTTPAHLPGYGPLPMGIVRDLLASEDLTVLIRRIYAHPSDNTLVAMDSKGILFTGGLRRMIFARDGDTCRTPGCNAPPRHGDHVTPRARGGPTTLDDGQGLCEECNYTKEQPGWTQETQTTWPQQHRVRITTPTGHTYDSHGPPLPVEPFETTTTDTGITTELYYADFQLHWEAA